MEGGIQKQPPLAMLLRVDEGKETAPNETRSAEIGEMLGQNCRWDMMKAIETTGTRRVQLIDTNHIPMSAKASERANEHSGASEQCGARA